MFDVYIFILLYENFSKLLIIEKILQIYMT